MSKYPYSKQWINDDDINAVVQALKGEYLTNGSYITDFEAAFAEAVGAKYAVAVSNGTAALHIAYMATGLRESDMVITTPLSFAATANAALFCKAKPVFIDIDNTGNINLELIEAAITYNTRLIAPVHYAGQPVDMAKIYAIADKHNLFVVEDACHALGARSVLSNGARSVLNNGVLHNDVLYRGNDSLVGNCRYSDMTAFSFHPVKHITTGEGGMVTTNNKALYERLKLLCSHGIVTADRPWHKDMQLLGYNYRMTDIQAALGLSQLKRLNLFLQERSRIADCYDRLLADSPYFTPLAVRADVRHARHLYPVLLANAIDRDAFMTAARQAGIGLQVHYGLIYKHRFYQRNGYDTQYCPIAENISARIVSLPIYPQLSNDEVAEIVQILSSLCSQQ